MVDSGFSDSPSTKHMYLGYIYFCVFQAGQLNLICLDGWNKINPTERTWIEKEISEDEFQYVVVSTEDGNLTTNVSEGTVNGDVQCSN